MKLIARLALLSVAAIPFAMHASADPQDQSRVVLDTSGKTPVYRVTVVERTTKAINYRHRSGSTEVDFRGTNLMPEARGQLIVNSKQGRIEIKARMEKLTPATQFGPETKMLDMIKRWGEETAKQAKEKKGLEMQYAEAFRRIKLHIPKEEKQDEPEEGVVEE